jgi:hypothetical protein
MRCAYCALRGCLFRSSHVTLDQTKFGLQDTIDRGSQVGLAQRNPTQSRQLCHSSSTCGVGLCPRANTTYRAATTILQKPKPFWHKRNAPDHRDNSIRFSKREIDSALAQSRMTILLDRQHSVIPQPGRPAPHDHIAMPKRNTALTVRPFQSTKLKRRRNAE